MISDPLTAFSLSTYQPGLSLAHFEVANLRGIVRLPLLCEVHDETGSHGRGWISRWIFRRTVGTSEYSCVVPAAAQDARSSQAEWPHDPQCPGFVDSEMAGADFIESGSYVGT